MFLSTESHFHAHAYTANDSDIWKPVVSMGTVFTVIADNTFRLDVHYECYVCSAFEPRDRHLQSSIIIIIISLFCGEWEQK